MPKECDCTEKSLGLPTLYPANHNYCFNCGKELKYVTEEEMTRRIKKLREEL